MTGCGDYSNHHEVEVHGIVLEANVYDVDNHQVTVPHHDDRGQTGVTPKVVSRR